MPSGETIPTIMINLWPVLRLKAGTLVSKKGSNQEEISVSSLGF